MCRPNAIQPTNRRSLFRRRSLSFLQKSATQLTKTVRRQRRRHSGSSIPSSSSSSISSSKKVHIAPIEGSDSAPPVKLEVAPKSDVQLNVAKFHLSSSLTAQGFSRIFIASKEDQERENRRVSEEQAATKIQALARNKADKNKVQYLQQQQQQQQQIKQQIKQQLEQGKEQDEVKVEKAPMLTKEMEQKKREEKATLVLQSYARSVSAKVLANSLRAEQMEREVDVKSLQEWMATGSNGRRRSSRETHRHIKEMRRRSLSTAPTEIVTESPAASRGLLWSSTSSSSEEGDDYGCGKKSRILPKMTAGIICVMASLTLSKNSNNTVAPLSATPLSGVRNFRDFDTSIPTSRSIINHDLAESMSPQDNNNNHRLRLSESIPPNSLKGSFLGAYAFV